VQLIPLSSSTVTAAVDRLISPSLSKPVIAMESGDMVDVVERIEAKDLPISQARAVKIKDGQIKKFITAP
jgi:hypothetical protein